MSERAPPRRLALAWAALLALLGLTWGGAYLPLGPFNLVLALCIAAAKAAIVLAVFMHPGRGPASVRAALAVGLAALALLGGLSGLDFATREVAPAAVQPPRQLAPLRERAPAPPARDTQR